MMADRVNILGIKIDNFDRKGAAGRVVELIEEGSSHIVATVNPLMVLKSRRDKKLKKILKSASLVIPDGAGLIWASRVLKDPLKERVSGINLVLDLIEVASERNFSVFFLGSRENVLNKATENLKKSFPQLQVRGKYHGYFDKPREREIVEGIRKANPDILFVGMGSPRQENWLYQFRRDLNLRVGIGIGGAFDVISGRIPRAPQWMQDWRMEWFYRIIIQPWRIFRVLKLPYFVFLVYLSRLFKKK